MDLELMVRTQEIRDALRDIAAELKRHNDREDKRDVDRATDRQPIV